MAETDEAGFLDLPRQPGGSLSPPGSPELSGGSLSSSPTPQACTALWTNTALNRGHLTREEEAGEAADGWRLCTEVEGSMLGQARAGQARKHGSLFSIRPSLQTWNRVHSLEF